MGKQTNGMNARPGPNHESSRPIRAHHHLTKAATAMPAITALVATCGSNNAPVKKHAPKKNFHCMRIPVGLPKAA